MDFKTLEKANELKRKSHEVWNTIFYLDNFLKDDIKTAYIGTSNNCTLQYTFKNKKELKEIVEILKSKREKEYNELINEFDLL